MYSAFSNDIPQMNSSSSDTFLKNNEIPTYYYYERSNSSTKEHEMENNQEKLFDAYILNEFKETAKEIKEDTKLIRKELKEEFKEEFKDLKEKNRNIHKEIKSLRTTVIVTTISAGVAILGIWISVTLSTSQINTAWLNTLSQIFTK